MALIPSVGTGQIITPTWGNGIRDRTIQYFATVAEIKSTWSTAPGGAFAYAADEDTVLVSKGGSWRLWRKTFALTVGTPVYGTWGTPVNGVNSASYLSVNGRSLALGFHCTLVTAAQTGGGVNIFNLAAGYRPAAVTNVPLAMGHGAGAGSGRGGIGTDGILNGVWAAGDNPSAATHVYCQVTYSVADLVAA